MNNERFVSPETMYEQRAMEKEVRAVPGSRTLETQESMALLSWNGKNTSHLVPLGSVLSSLLSWWFEMLLFVSITACLTVSWLCWPALSSL